MELLSGLFGSDLIFGWLGEVLNSEVAKMTIAFMLAARMHRRWVKRDLELLTSAINNIGEKLSEGLALHSKRIDDLSGRVENLESKKNN